MIDAFPQGRRDATVVVDGNENCIEASWTACLLRWTKWRQLLVNKRMTLNGTQ